MELIGIRLMFDLRFYLNILSLLINISNKAIFNGKYLIVLLKLISGYLKCYLSKKNIVNC